ncbi:SH3 domain-containing protein [Peribacillus sp. NPDC046944]|uniref:SH3 domain-containing protein n=1 Tax=unclassified Peribacillus TaxID=2675266 RepID=UPI003CFDD684
MGREIKGKLKKITLCLALTTAVLPVSFAQGGFSTTAYAAEAAFNATGKITAPSGYNVRSAPKATAKRIGGVYKDNIVTIVAKDGEWYKIKFGSGYGYIMAVSSGLQITATPSNEVTYNATGKITATSGFNVRTSKNISSTRIGGVYQNDMVSIVAKAGDWYKIKYGTGYGYIMAVSSGLTITRTTTTPPTTGEIVFNSSAKITTPSGLNVRNAAKANATRIGGVYVNDIVTIVAKSGDFYKIKFGYGYGYISNNSSYLSLVTQPPIVPPVAVDKAKVFQNALLFTLGAEGGYVNDPNDYGGPTNMGVTQPVFTSYLKAKGRAWKDVRYITRAEAEDVYYTLYWKPAKCDRMAPALAVVMFDTAVNLGVNGNTYAGGAIKHLQKAMGITADGSWGAATENKFASYNLNQHYDLALKVIDFNKSFRHERVRQDPSQKKYLQGWLNRDNNLLKFVSTIPR